MHINGVDNGNCKKISYEIRIAIFSATLLIVLILLSFFNTPLVSFILAVTAFYAIGELVHFLLEYFLGEAN